MAYLLDTHVFIWLAFGDRRLSKSVIALLADVEQDLYLSVVSRWEIALKQRKQDYLLPEPVDALFARSPFKSLDLCFDVPGRLDALPPIHADPFDRLIVAHALAAGLTLVSRDEHVVQYPVPLFW